MSDDEYNSLKLTGLPIYDETEEKKCRTLDAPGFPSREASTLSEAEELLRDTTLSAVGAIRFFHDEGSSLFLYFHPVAA